MQCPLDYSLCDQTVTVYGIRDGAVTRQVFENAMYQHWQKASVETDGKSCDTGCLLIIPGQADLRPGDRVCPGVGPESTEWAGLLPVLVPGLSQLTQVRPCYWQGQVCHTEGRRGSP